MMISPAQIDVCIADGFVPEACYADANKKIVRAIYELHTSGGEVDAVTIANHMGESLLRTVGGRGYLAQLTDATPAVLNVLEHARIVTEKRRVRDAITLLQAAVAEGYGDPAEPQQYLERVELGLAELAHGGRVAQVEQIGIVVDRETTRLSGMQESGQKALGFETGFPDLDRVMGGLFVTDLTIIAARPGVGKTAFLTSLVKNIAHKLRAPSMLPVGSLFFSQEMSKMQLAQRFLAYDSGVSVTDIRTTVLHRDAWAKILEAAAVTRPEPIWVDDTPQLTLPDVRAKIRRLKREIETGASTVPCAKLGVVGIDYLQLMKGVRERGDSREQEVASLSRGLKGIAKEEEVAIVCLSQLNRALEKQQNKRPGLADLRESGAIEQDADNVLFLYREAYYDRGSKSNEAECDLAKQRNGPTATVSLFYEGSRMRFQSMSKYEDYDNGNDPEWFESR